MVKIRLKPSALKQSAELISEVSKLTQELPDAEVTIVSNETALESTLGTDESPLMIEVTGRDIDVLDTLQQILKTASVIFRKFTI